MDFIFEEGRATVALSDNTVLSIINEDRNKVIYGDVMRSIFGGQFDDDSARANSAEDEYEICILTADQEECDLSVNPECFQPYFDKNFFDGRWRVFCNVPKSVIEKYIEEVGLASEATE